MQTIGVLITFLGGYYFRDLLAGVYQVAQERGYQVIVYRGTPTDIVQSGVLLDRVSGWISVIETSDLDLLRQRGTPVVMASNYDPTLECPTVLTDSYGGEYAAVTHLIEHGHTRIAYIGYRGHEDMRQRYNAYEKALLDHGITPDPRLLVELAGYEMYQGDAGFQELVQRDVPFTAIAAGNDLNAQGILNAAHRAGYNVPEDFALLGFDDINDVQYTNPPLTTVRQLVEPLGRLVANLLIDQINGQPVTIGKQYMPTTLVRRRSCGCDLVRQLTLNGHDPDADPADQIGNLERQLLRITLLSDSVEPEQAPPALRQAVRTLASGAVDAALGGEGPTLAELGRAWRTICALIFDLEAMSAIVTALDETGTALPAQHSADPAIKKQHQGYMKRVRLELLRAQVAVQRVVNTRLEEQVASNYQVSTTLLDNDDDNDSNLAWLRHTPVSHGYLALWDGAQPAKSARLVLTSVYNAAPGQAELVGQRYPAALFPPLELCVPADQLAPSAISVMFPIVSPSRSWGVMGLVCDRESWMFADQKNIEVWATLLGTAFERSELIGSLRSQQDTLKQSYEREHILAATVRELGSPIIPLLPGVLMVPLIGAIDSERARQMMDTVLHSIEHQQVREVLVDVTGVSVIDTQVAAGIIQMAQAAMLLGAAVTLVGIRPEIAETIVSLGIGLGKIHTKASLAAALADLI
jgi:DNA-binding LacI/PurR family transcriptional regulator/anti-anti-sigma regulatory factor